MTALTHPDLTVYKKYTTPKGTPVTVYQFASGVDTVTFGIGDEFAQDTDLTCIPWCHGSGGGNTKLTDSTTGWVDPRDGWADNGIPWFEVYGSQTSINNGKQHWARTFARNGYSIPAQQLMKYLPGIQRYIVVGTSMGGTIAKYLATRDPFISPRTVGLVDAAGIYNFEAEFDAGVAGTDGEVKDRFDLARYYGTTWPDRPSFMAATADNDPARFNPAVWDGLPVFIIVGDADVTAVKGRAGQMLWNRYGPTGQNRFDARSRYVEVPGAGHATAAMYNDPRILQWTLDLLGIVPPTPPSGDIYEVEAHGYVSPTGEFFTVEAGIYRPSGFIVLDIGGGVVEVIANGTASIVVHGGTATLTGPIRNNNDGTATINPTT